MMHLTMQLASDAGAVVSMTEGEKKRLEKLLSDSTEMEVGFEGICIDVIVVHFFYFTGSIWQYCCGGCY